VIANQTFGDDFGDLGDYLRRGRGRVDPSQRVGWVEFRNLPTRRMDIAERIMAGTASLSYTSKPVFHLSISFAPGDAVDEALMKRVMARTLADLGLGEHQAVIVAHIDTDDPHMHAMVNRVHPETGVAWKGSWSRLRAEASLRRQELDEGLRVVPGWLARVPRHPELRPRPRLVRADEEFLREVRQRAEPVLEHAQSWADVEAGLAEFGLSVRVNGRGMSITDGRQQVKASEVGRQFSRGNLEEQFGRYSDYSARVAVASAKSIRDAGGASPARVGIESKAQPERRAAPEAQPRFSLYEDDGIFGVWDSRGPQIFFAETRERAEAEMQRAEWLAARYPNIRAVRCLCDMDGECRDARALPRLPEEKGRAPRTVHLVAVAENPHADVAAADIAPEPPTPAVQPELPTEHVELAQPQAPEAAPRESEELIAPRFSLYEDGDNFGVYDSAGPAVFFADTRERALAEVERANEIVAVYPKAISIGFLREMDGAWRDAHGLPRLPEPEGHRISVHWPGSLPAEARVAPVTQAETAPADEIASPTVVEGGEEPIRVLEPLPPTEPVREEGEAQQHGLEPPGHGIPDQSAHEQGRDGGPDAPAEVRSDDPAVEAAVHAFTALQDACAAAELTRTLRAERTRAEEVLATLDQQDEAIELAQQDFQATAAMVYHHPTAAMAKWDRLVLKHKDDLESAAKQVRTKPEILGPLLIEPPASLRESIAEMFGSPSTRSAEEAVPQMLRRAVLYTPTLREAAKPVEWETPDGEKIVGRTPVRLRANAVVAGRTAQIKAAEARIPEIGGVAGAERNVQLAFRGLSPAQRSQAGRELTAWAAANDITEAAVAANLAEVLGKTHRAARRARELGEGPRGF
jgi:Relaxase/Mobilisation nuclease domain